VVERFEITLDGLRQLHRRLGDYQVERHDFPLLAALVWKQIARFEGRQERMAAKIAAAKAAAATEDPVGPVIDAEYTIRDSDTDGGAASSVANATSRSSEPGFTGQATGAEDAGDKVERKKPKGHGRTGAGAYYTRAKHIFYALAVGVIGAVCEACGIGKILPYREKIIIRIIGQPSFCAELHHFEQGRCRNCGHIVRATSPSQLEGIGSDYVRYDWSAGAMLMVLHYFGGAPFKRLESLHRGWGIPLADANLWNLVDACDDRLLPLYRALEQHAIQNATNFRIDDTGSMIVALQRQIEAEVAALELLGESTRDVRTGINATGIYWETPNGPVILFFTGRHHAGEITDQLLRYRQISSPKLVKLSDGASKNFDHQQGDKLIEATCNAHAFLKFQAIKDKYPGEYAVAGRVYKQVFDHDDEAKARGLTPIERMLYHREHSKPLMVELKAMCEEKLKSKLVEPNSPLWEPLTFVVNQFDRLIRFCEVPDAPLDSNLVEQVLIMAVRYLAGSFNYHTEDGAVVGDHAMSLIASARANDVEPVAYLTECLRCHEDLARRPEHYLPWVYRERMKKEGDSPPGPTREQPGDTSREPEALSTGPPDDYYATLRQSSGKAQLAGSPPQIST
jgi:hypothetical protein